jgi:hypothetical protein
VVSPPPVFEGLFKAASKAVEAAEPALALPGPHIVHDCSKWLFRPSPPETITPGWPDGLDTLLSKHLDEARDALALYLFEDL